MAITLILSTVLMAVLFMMILVAVTLVRDKRLFTTAPKDIQAVIQDRPERFPGAQLLGWLLLVLCLLTLVGSYILGAWDDIQNRYTYWQFFCGFPPCSTS